MNLEEQTIRAARTLTVWKRSQRKLVSVEITEYSILLEGLNPKQVGVENDVIKLVTLDRLEAIKFLSAKYKLYDANSTCRNIDGQ